MKKANSTELSELLGKDEIEELERNDIELDEENEEEEEEEVVVPAPKKKRATMTKAKQAPKKKKEAATLSEFINQEKYEQTEDYERELDEEEILRTTLSTPKELDNILNMASVTDLNKITIVEKSKSFSNRDNFQFLLNTKSTYQVTLNQSAYIAHMEGMRFADLFSVNNTIANNYEVALKKYQMYFSKINANSLGMSSFEDFTEMTSMFDVNTIEFGIFNQTFPGSSEYTITCGHCDKVMSDLKLSNDYLITAKNEEVYSQLGRVINSINSPERATKYSLINKTDRFQLSDSKAIVDIRIPTIADHLSLLQQLREDQLAKAEDYIEMLLFIKDIFVVNLEETLSTGQPAFSKLADRNEVLQFIKKATFDDVNTMNTELTGKEEKYRIDYEIKSFPCHYCAEETGNIPVDISDMLFQQTLRKLQA